MRCPTSPQVHKHATMQKTHNSRVIFQGSMTVFFVPFSTLIWQRGHL